MPESRADVGWRRIVMKLSFVCYKITQLHLNLLQDCPVFLAESANSDIIRLSTPEPDSDPDEDSAGAHWHRLVRARRGDSSSAADRANPPAPLPSSPQQGHQDPDPRDLCIHERTSRMGSNQFASMVRCKDCGATLGFSVKRSESDNSDWLEWLEALLQQINQCCWKSATWKVAAAAKRFLQIRQSDTYSTYSCMICQICRQAGKPFNATGCNILCCVFKIDRRPTAERRYFCIGGLAFTIPFFQHCGPASSFVIQQLSLSREILMSRDSVDIPSANSTRIALPHCLLLFR